MNKLNKILLVLLIGTLVLCNRAYATVLDSGIPIPKEYTKELVVEYIGKKVSVSYVNGKQDNKMIVNVIGILFDRRDQEGFVLLGKTEFRSRIVIPIEQIYLIEEIK